MDIYKEIEKSDKRVVRLWCWRSKLKVKRKERKLNLKITYLFSAIYLGSVATTYLVVEGDQAWRVGSSPFPIYTMNKRAS